MQAFDLKEVLATIREMIRDGHKYVSFTVTDRQIDGDGEPIPSSLVLSGFGDDPSEGETEYDEIDEVELDL